MIRLHFNRSSTVHLFFIFETEGEAEDLIDTMFIINSHENKKVFRLGLFWGRPYSNLYK